VFYDYAKNIEKTVAAQPDCLAVLKLHYLRWVLSLAACAIGWTLPTPVRTGFGGRLGMTFLFPKQ
jgi:hypothetical protein